MSPNIAVKINRGFTLIEVMVAMAIFAVAGTALLSSATSNLRALGKLEENTIASWVASNQLVEATLNKKWPPDNDQQGQVKIAGRDWFWRQKVVKTTDKNMRAIVVEVRTSEKQPSAITSMLTYVSKSQP